MLNSVTTWLTTSGIKVLGILIALVILSQMAKWIVKWLEKSVPERDSLQAISFIALLVILGELGMQLGPL